MVKAYVETFQKYRYLLANLISRDLKIKYRRSVLGVLWSLLNPILMMLLLSAVFSRLLGGYVDEVTNFPLYLMTGQTLYTFFSEATNGAMESIVQSASLMKKVYVPKYVFPVEKVLYSFVNLFFSLAAIIVMFAIYRQPFTFTMLLAPIPLFAFLLFTLGFGMLLSALYAFFRDVKHLYSVILLAWMYLTPIIYPISRLGESGFIRTIVNINPLTWFVTYFRTVFLNGALPDLTMNLVTFGYAVGMLLIGLIVFKKTQDRFVLHI